MKTDKHDKIHLWMHNPENLKEFVTTITRTITAGDIRELTKYIRVQPPEGGIGWQSKYDFKALAIRNWKSGHKEVEVPIVKGKSVTHTNTIDCIIHLKAYCTRQHRRHEDADDGWELTDAADFPIVLLCEYKPELESVSSLLGQINIYKARVRDMLSDDCTILPVLVTFDKNTEYDKLIMDQGIRIYRLDFSQAFNVIVNKPIIPAAQAEAIKPTTE